MTSSQFILYLNGFVESLHGQQPTPAQWETIKSSLKESLENPVIVEPAPRFQIEKEPLNPVAILKTGDYNPSGFGNGVAYVTGSLPNWGAVSGVLGGYIDYGQSNRGNSYQIYHPKREEPVLNSPLDKMWLPVPLRALKDMIDRIT